MGKFHILADTAPAPRRAAVASASPPRRGRRPAAPTWFPARCPEVVAELDVSGDFRASEPGGVEFGDSSGVGGAGATAAGPAGPAGARARCAAGGGESCADWL